MFKTILQYFLFLSVSLLYAQLTRGTIQSGPIDYIDQLPEIPLCAVPGLTDSFIQNHMEKMKNEYPEIYRRMQIPPVRKKAAQIGDLEKFWVMVDDGSGGTKSEEIVAELLAKGDHTAIWADTAEIKNSTNISAALATSYLKLLEEETPAGSRNSSKGIYDLELEYFGSPPNYDGDGIVDFLFADIYSGAGGYFYPLDQTNQTGSNRRDIVYLDTYASVSYTQGTLSHELQHVIHYNYDQYETVQFNEGLSELATIICGGDYISHAHYLNQADQIGWNWDSDAAHYSMASLFSVYFVEQLGDGAIKEFITLNAGTNVLRGWQAFDQLLRNHNVGQTHKEWLVDWFTANYLDNKSMNSKYGYDLWLPMRARYTAKHLSGNVESAANTIQDYGSNYIAYESSADSMEITFSATSGGTPYIRSIEYNDSSAVVNTLSNDAKHLVYHYKLDYDNDGIHDSLKVRSALFIVVNQESFSLKYDYVSTGTDASGWTGFEEIAHDDGELDLFTTSDGGQFGFLGWGNNSTGWGWGVKFDPKMATNQLVEIKIVFGFDQEFSGSTTPATADKDFNIHVWEILDDDGNIRDVMTPLYWSTQRASLTGDWTIIDMTPFKDELSNLGPIVIGVVEDDTVGTYFGMDHHVNDENYTYAFNYNDGGTLDELSGFNIGGESLSGWNYLFRTSFYIADNTVPHLTAGFMQNPVFTDELNLFIIGNSMLGSDHMTVTTKNAGYEEILDTHIMAGNDSILVTDNYRIHASGALDINVKGTMRYGRANMDTTFTYNVNYILARVGGDIASRDGNYHIYMPENSLVEDGYVIVGNDDNSPATAKMRTALVDQIHPIYTVSPVGRDLEKGAKISIDTGSLDPETISIGYWDGEVWRELHSTLASDGRRMEGIGIQLGHYTLIPRGSGSPLAISEEAILPTEYSLYQNYPNPFNPETMIHYDIPRGGHVFLVIYDILGRELIRLVNQFQHAGRYDILWDGNNAKGLPAVSGVYFFRISSNGFSQTRKMVLSR